MCPRRAGTRQPPPPCLAAPSFPWMSLAMPRYPQARGDRSLSCSFSPAPAPHHGRSHRKLTVVVRIATPFPSTARCVCEIRHIVLFVHAEPCFAGSRASSSPPSSSTSDVRDRRRRFAPSKPSPSTKSFSKGSLRAPLPSPLSPPSFSPPSRGFHLAGARYCRREARRQ